MTTAIDRPVRWFQNPLLLPAIVVILGLFFVGTTQWGLSGPLCLALIAQVIFFLLLLYRPVWAIAALIVGQFTESDYMFPLMGTMISVRFLWTIMAISFLVPILIRRGGIKLGAKAKRVVIPAIMFVSIATVANYVNTDLADTVKYLRIHATGLTILFLLPATVKNGKDIKILAVVALVTASISALVAVMQHYSFRGFPVYELYPGTFMNQRTPGLTLSEIHLSFYLPIIIVVLVAIYFLRAVGPRARKLLLILMFIMMAGLFFTLTRSGMYALVPGLLALILLMKGKMRMRLLVIFLIMAVGFLGYSEIKNNRFSKGFGEEKSAAARLVLWQAGVNIAKDNPVLGIGSWRYKEVSAAYASTIDPELMATMGAGADLGEFEAHADFITVWVSFGTLALLAYLWLFVSIFRNFFVAYRESSTRFLKAISLGCFGAMAAYIVNAATHNVMDNSMLLWILGGLSIATTKLALSKRPSKAKIIS